MARMADAIGNSFLIIVLPLYIESGAVVLTGLAGTSLLGVELTVELLVGVVLSLFGLLNSFGQPFTGRLSDRLGRRRPFVLFGLGLFGVGSAAYPFLDSYLAVMGARILQGVGAAFTIPATIALVNEYSAGSNERGGNFGVFNTFRLIGFGFGPIVAGLVVAAGPYATPVGRLSGFDAAFAVAVLGAVVSFAMVSVLIRDPPGLEAAAGDDLSFRVRDRDGGLDSVFVLGVGTFFMATGIALFAPLQTTIRTALNEGSFLFSVQFAAVVIANVLFQVPVGRASDRFGRRRFIVAGFALLVPSVLAQGYVPAMTPGLTATLPAALTRTIPVGPTLMLLLRLLQGVSVALVFAPSLALAGDLAGSNRSGTTLSVLTMAFGLGVAIGPLAAGYLVAFGFATPFVFGAALAGLALVLTYVEVEDPAPPGTPGPEAVLHDD